LLGHRDSRRYPSGGWSRAFHFYFDRLGIVLIHVGTGVALLQRHVDAGVLGLAALSYLVRMFAVTAAYHRYFAHRAFKTSRAFQLCLALIGTSATQKGPLWWASAHRRHHKYSDTPKDLHSPKQRGFWHAHMGWWFGREHEETDFGWVADWARFPELRFVDRHYHLGVFACMAICAALRGWDGFMWGYVVSTCALMHATFAINSVAHVFGSRRYETADTSRNNWWLAILALGEGWHNNHHRYMSSARQGFTWWEIDITYYALKGLSWLGIIWDLRSPPIERPVAGTSRPSLPNVRESERSGIPA
jgi:stearoyl-CoA desaturase (delta-9 desaturase)